MTTWRERFREVVPEKLAELLYEMMEKASMRLTVKNVNGEVVVTGNELLDAAQ